MDAEDVDVSNPDEKSYMASYYDTFSKMKAVATGRKRIDNIVLRIKSIEDQQAYSTIFLLWTNEQASQMLNKDFSNKLEGIHVRIQEVQRLQDSGEASPMYMEKVEGEGTTFLYFVIS